MKIYNSLTNKIEEFKPITPGVVNMYACGPTVYNYPHIGNARPIVVFDTLKNTLEALGYQVKYVSNFTDVDDKIINKALEEGVDEKIIAERYIVAYNNDRLALNAAIPDACPRVTDTMEAIIAYIGELEAKGFAYAIDGDVYFRVTKIADYGKLSGQKIEDLMVGARIDENSRKENPLDFTLWKQTDQGVKWDSPWGKGRPGWHTECVVMIRNEFKTPLIDIHGGGMDLKFPHHENEMAQGCASDHSNVANYWVHNGMINIDGEKMSKSLGNVVWAKDFIEKFGGNQVRWLLLSAHYRAPLNLSEETINNAGNELNKIETSLKQVQVKYQLAGIKNDESQYESSGYQEFLDAMSDDLNTPNAFKALFETNKKLNQSLRTRDIDFNTTLALYNSILKMLKVLGIKPQLINLTAEDKQMFKDWDEAKKAKDFAAADQYRNALIAKGLL